MIIEINIDGRKLAKTINDELLISELSYTDLYVSEATIVATAKEIVDL